MERNNDKTRRSVATDSYVTCGCVAGTSVEQCLQVVVQQHCERWVHEVVDGRVSERRE
jgi:hypothetical protein